ncbi:MAG: serine protease, partial [Proteobacteria bacterium]
STSAGTAGVDINVDAIFKEGNQGSGINVFIADDGVEGTHEDLYNNLRKGFARDYTKSGSYDANWVTLTDGTFSDGTPYHDDHGTSVAGLIAAEAMNSMGSRGVAPKAKISVGNLLSGAVMNANGPTLDMLLDQINQSVDVVNQSWGTSQDRLDFAENAYIDQMKQAATSGRSGKGMLIVKSAGNSFAVEVASNTFRFGNVNFDGYNTTPYTVNVSAVNAKGNHSSYSSFGSAVWVAGPGGEFGDDAPAIITSDRTGCSAGHSQTTATTNAFDRGGSGNSSCKYTASFNGTSSAAPIVTGVIALILEDNPSLSWRDVKHILASTSRRLEPAATKYNFPDSTLTWPTGLVWEQGWVKNSAGFYFNNVYGFGLVDADAAVRFTKVYSPVLGTQKESAWVSSSSNLNLSVPDNNATGITNALT